MGELGLERGEGPGGVGAAAHLGFNKEVVSGVPLCHGFFGVMGQPGALWSVKKEAPVAALGCIPSSQNCLMVAPPGSLSCQPACQGLCCPGAGLLAMRVERFLPGHDGGSRSLPRAQTWIVVGKGGSCSGSQADKPEA